MRVYKTLVAVAALLSSAAPNAVQAQLRRFPADPAPRRANTTNSADTGAPDVRALLGISLGSSGTERDTLGLLVTQVTRDGPADRAGIDEGNRIAEIDGLSLRLDPSDIGRSEASDAMMRRLTRTLRGLREGEPTNLRVFSGGRFRSVQVQVARVPNAAVTTAPTAPTAPTAVAIAGEPANRANTVSGAIQVLADLQMQLRRLADDENGSPLGDSLLQASRDVGAIQRRLRSTQADQQRRRNDDSGDRALARRGNNIGDVPGLSLSPVSDDLADYFGDGSERGLLVLQADASWAPIRNGDVLLSVDGAQVTADRLRTALDSRQPVRIELLRRRRQVTVTLGGRE